MSNWKIACKWIVIVSLLFLAVPIRVKHPKDDQITALFHSYMDQFNKSYVAGSSEYDRRFEIFKETLSHINTLNHDRKGNHSARYGVTQFSDLTSEEFINQYLDRVKRFKKEKNRLLYKTLTKAMKNDQKPSQEIYLSNNVDFIDKTFPSKVDWRSNGIISDVTSQGLCGACWAYSVVQVAEAMAAKQVGNITKYSVQQMVDCATNGNFGCKGGDICSLLSWLISNKITILTELDYPVTGSSGKCLYPKKNITQKGIKIESFTCNSYLNNEKEIIQTVATVGPVAVAINALTWQYYLGGVIQHHCPGDNLSLNHAVQIVGYDLTAEIPYYIVKNSWGKSFGIDGYLHIAIGNNVCGLALEVSSIQVEL